MPNPLQKSLNGYLSKIKRETRKLQLSSSNSLSCSKKWVLAGCKNPKKLSLSFKHKRRSSKIKFKENEDVYKESSHAATLSDIDRFLEENFKSLCIKDDDDEDQGKRESSDDYYHHRFEKIWGPVVYNSPKPLDAQLERLSPPPESFEGRASIDTTSTSMSNSSRSTHVLPENCIAVLRYTAEPQEDFKRSMVEMMQDKEVDWDLMEELIFCYLHLHDKKSHRFILSAFVDLIINFREKKRITKKGLARSLSTRAARERLKKRMTIPN